MHDDVSSIPLTGCNVLTSDRTISNYNGRNRFDFIFNGGKWYEYRHQTSTYNDYDITPYNCIDVSDLNTYAVFTPIMYGIGFLLFACSIYLFFLTIRGFMYGIK